MSFRVRPFNHSPQWYRAHCHEEDGGSAAFRAMLTADMKYLDADNDKTLAYEEKIGIYEDSWNDVLCGKNGNADAADLQEVMEREGLLGFRPQVEYSQGGFEAIARSIKKFGLTPNDVREFLKWTAKNESAKKARAAKPKMKVAKKTANDIFFEREQKSVCIRKTKKVVKKAKEKMDGNSLASKVQSNIAGGKMKFSSADFA